MNKEKITYQISEIIKSERINEPDNRFTDKVLHAIGKYSDNKQITIISRLNSILRYAAVIAIGILMGSLTAQLLLNRLPKLPDESKHELLLKSIDNEPLETFLISYAN